MTMHCVYRFYAADGELLYTGMSSNPLERFHQHARKDWFPLIASARLEHFSTRAEARAAEARAISDERPRHNRIGLSYAAAKLREEWVFTGREDHSGNLRAALERIAEARELLHPFDSGLNYWKTRAEVDGALARAEGIVAKLLVERPAQDQVAA